MYPHTHAAIYAYAEEAQTQASVRRLCIRTRMLLYMRIRMYSSMRVYIRACRMYSSMRVYIRACRICPSRAGEMACLTYVLKEEHVAYIAVYVRT